MRTSAKVLALFFLATLAHPVQGVEMVPDWHSISDDPFPLVPACPVEPILTAADVTDANALFVADPFLMHEEGLWHMFFEVYVIGAYLGRIGHATSEDGLLWQYDRLVLTEDDHLAFPFVFKCDGTYYMLLTLSERQTVKLYKAYDFPCDWREEATILSGRQYADAVILRHNGLWWLFTGRSASGCCYLFYSVRLESGWTEHPWNPIVNDFGKGRPAGRFFVYDDGRVIRLAQKNDLWYGQAVRAFEVDLLTTTSYAEHEIPESPILRDSGEGWNSDGMHTCDAWWDGTHWLAVVDGIASWWTIGMYRTFTAADAAEPSQNRPVSIALHPNIPNPFVASTRVDYVVSRDPREIPARITVFDGQGTLVREFPASAGAAGMRWTIWNGTDAGGRTVPAGVYFYRLTQGNETVTRKMIRIR